MICFSIQPLLAYHSSPGHHLDELPPLFSAQALLAFKVHLGQHLPQRPLCRNVTPLALPCSIVILQFDIVYCLIWLRISYYVLASFKREHLRASKDRTLPFIYCFKIGGLSIYPGYVCALWSSTSFLTH